MKIWIVSSDPFLGDFNRLASRYAAQDTVVVTTVSRYGVSIMSMLKFAMQYLRLRPDLIISDYGYLGFVLVRLLAALTMHPVRTVLFLRGNWWLESGKMRRGGRNLPIGRTVTVTVTAPSGTPVSLREPGSSTKLSPFSTTYAGEVARWEYRSLWAGDFVVSAGGEEAPITTASDGISRNGQVEVRVERVLTWRWSEFTVELGNRLYLYGWEWSFAHFSELTAVCGWLVDEIRVRTGREASIIPTPVEIPHALATTRLELEHPSVLIMQNHQVEQKSAALVRFEEVIRRLPNVRFYVSRGLPENQSSPNYTKVVRALGALPNVTFVDVDGSNKYDYLSSTDMYVLVSGLDCTPATVLEAGVARKPVVVSAVGGVPEMVVEGVTGWAIPNGEWDSWVARIDTLSSNSSLAATMGEANRAHVEAHYGLDTFAEALYALRRGQ